MTTMVITAKGHHHHHHQIIVIISIIICFIITIIIVGTCNSITIILISSSYHPHRHHRRHHQRSRKTQIKRDHDGLTTPARSVQDFLLRASGCIGMTIARMRLIRALLITASVYVSPGMQIRTACIIGKHDGQTELRKRRYTDSETLGPGAYNHL